MSVRKNHFHTVLGLLDFPAFWSKANKPLFLQVLSDQKRNFRPMPEKLEERALMAVTATLDNGLLSILGDNDPNFVVVRPSSNSPGGLAVDGVSIRVLNRTPINRIEVSAMQGDDYIDLGLVSVPSTIYAGKGNDMVIGTMVNDLIFAGFGDDQVNGRQGSDTIDLGPGNDIGRGGKGHDTIFGADGDDTLYGELGSDTLDGGSGSDALFGGTGDGQDNLRGGSGPDRFLVPLGEDTVLDLASEDARVNFANSPSLSGIRFLGQEGTSSFAAGAWDNAQIERVAEPLANLQRQTGNTRLLKTASRSEMTFLAVGPQTSGWAAGGWNTGTTIAMVNVQAMSSTWLPRVVYHEMGHNWDDPAEHGSVSSFRSVSGWIERDSTPTNYTASAGVGDRWQFLTSASGTFARDYGKTNPYEDVATTWESYFMNAYHGGSSTLRREGLVANVSKFATLDMLFADLSRSA